MAELRSTLLGWIDADQDSILNFMQTMVRVRSPNPPGDTRDVMRLVRAHLDGCGLAYTMVNRDDTMPNLVATQAFDAGDRHLVLNGHIDVFPVETSEGWSQDPWGGQMEGAIWGRGSADMKVGTSASIMTYVYLARLAEHLAGKLTLTVVSEEESFGPNGARYLFDACPDLIMGTALLNGEPSGASVVRFGEKGALWLRMTVQTQGGHGAYPHLSPNAIEKAFELIADLKKLADMTFEEPEVVVSALERSRADYDQAYGEGASDLARKVTMNIGTINGGSRVNMIASRCSFDVDVRLPNGADADELLARIDGLRDRHQFTYEVLLLNRPNWTDPQYELALIVGDTAEMVTGIRPVPAVSLGNTDARLWRYEKIPSVVYGPSPRGMGSTNEYVPNEEALNVVRCHVLSAAAYLLRKS
jgi:succinyl-diaminopimelate desuccinylase